MIYANGEQSIKTWDYAYGRRSLFGGKEIASLEVTNRRVISSARGKHKQSHYEIELSDIQAINISDKHYFNIFGLILIILGALGMAISAPNLLDPATPRGVASIIAIGAILVLVGIMMLSHKRFKIYFYLSTTPRSFLYVNTGRMKKIKQLKKIKLNAEVTLDIYETLGSVLLNANSIK